MLNPSSAHPGRSRSLMLGLSLFVAASGCSKEEGDTDSPPIDAGASEAGALPSADAPVGQCRARLPVDTACSESRACQPDLACLGGRCQPPGEVGTACELLSDCVDGLFCDRDAPGGAVCQVRLGEGEACAGRSSACVRPLICWQNLCAPERLDGEPCATLSDCVSGSYCQRLQPDGTEADEGLCTPREADGTPCDIREALMCENACIDGRCQPRDAVPPEEAECETDSSCGPGAYCDRYDQNGVRRSTGLCAAAPALGEVCVGGELVRESPCDEGTCFQGRCIDDVALGGACGESYHCASGLYCQLDAE